MNKGEKDMLVLMIAKKIIEGTYEFKRVPKKLKEKVYKELDNLLEDDELLEQLTSIKKEVKGE